MNRQQKELVVAEFRKMFDSSASTFLVNYKGLNVSQLQALRRGLREKNGLFKVTKASLMKIAARQTSTPDAGLSRLVDSFHDQVGLVFSADPSVIAKGLVDFAKENQSLQIIAGLYESRLLTREDVIKLASLPSREVLLAHLLGALQGPIVGLARTLNGVLAKLVFALSAVKEQKEKGL